VLPTTLFGFKTRDYFDKELVCVHIYDPSRDLPEPLLSQYRKFGRRSSDTEYFQIGLAELILCRTEMKLLDMFQYFWPVSRPEVKRLRGSIKILFRQPFIEGADSLIDFQTIVKKQNNLRAGKKEALAVILTLNEYTKYGCSLIVDICRSSGIEEFVIFKDPSRPPYLCSYPSQQKGFKRPPPIGVRFGKMIAKS
jgi:hypothetical protein